MQTSSPVRKFSPLGSAEETTYQDNWFDRICIALFTHQMSKALGGRTTKRKGYEGIVDLSTKIMQGRNCKQQQAVVTRILKSIIPAPVRLVVRRFISPNRLVCELNAWCAAKLFKWLVGPCEVRRVEIVNRSRRPKIQNSNVYIRKCRYLESSNCAGMCINMCKLPTQDFFTRNLGIPLAMRPNFEDFSCEMVFGQVPPPFETEASYNQPCLAESETATDGVQRPCPKVRDYT